jgi:hypothetical protein
MIVNNAIINIFPTYTYIYVKSLHHIYMVLGLELRAFILSHSTSSIFVRGFSGIGSLPGLQTTILLISAS